MTPTPTQTLTCVGTLPQYHYNTQHIHAYKQSNLCGGQIYKPIIQWQFVGTNNKFITPLQCTTLTSINIASFIPTFIFIKTKIIHCQHIEVVCHCAHHRQSCLNRGYSQWIRDSGLVVTMGSRWWTKGGPRVETCVVALRVYNGAWVA